MAEYLYELLIWLFSCQKKKKKKAQLNKFPGTINFIHQLNDEGSLYYHNNVAQV